MKPLTTLAALAVITTVLVGLAPIPAETTPSPMGEESDACACAIVISGSASSVDAQSDDVAIVVNGSAASEQHGGQIVVQSSSQSDVQLSRSSNRVQVVSSESSTSVSYACSGSSAVTVANSEAVGTTDGIHVRVGDVEINLGDEDDTTTSNRALNLIIGDNEPSDSEPASCDEIDRRHRVTLK